MGSAMRDFFFFSYFLPALFPVKENIFVPLVAPTNPGDISLYTL